MPSFPQFVEALIQLALCGSLLEVCTHEFIKERSLVTASGVACMFAITVMGLFNFVPELKDFMQLDEIDMTKTFAVATLIGVLAVTGGIVMASWLLKRSSLKWS